MSIRQYIGAGAFDPQANLDHTLAAAVLERLQPAARYASDAGTWIVRGSDRWEDVGRSYTRTLVAEVASLMPSGSPQAEKGSDEANRAERRKRFMTAGPAGAVATTMEALARVPSSVICVKLSELDSEPHVLWAGGQAWDLRESFERPRLAEDIDPGTPHLHSAAVAPWTPSTEDHIAGRVKVTDLDTPAWDELLALVWPDDTVRAWALRVLSISLTGSPDAALPVLYGEEGRGKTSVVKMLMSVLGTYAHAVNPKLLTDSTGHDSATLALRGLRLAFIDEAPSDARKSQERLKQLTGGGEMTGNRMRQDPVTFSPTHTLVLTANDPPRLDAEGLRRRVRLIPCTGDPDAVRRFMERHSTPAGQRQWQREMPLVLAKLMHEAAQWIDDPGSASLAAAPGAVEALVDELIAEQDPVAAWISDATEPWTMGTPPGQLHSAFTAWCREHAVVSIPTLTKFGLRLNKLGYPKARPDRTWVRGLRVRPLVETLAAEASRYLAQRAADETTGGPRK